MGILQKIGKWQSGSLAFARIEFLPLPNGLGVRILQLDTNGNIQSEVKAFENHIIFWSYAGLTLYWVAHMSYKYSHMEKAGTMISAAITSAFKEEDLPAELKLNDDCLDRVNRNPPYLELIVSKAMGGMDILPYNLPIGNMALPIEAVMINALIRHYLKIFPPGYRCFITAMTDLLKFPLANHHKGSLTAARVMNEMSEQLMLAMTQDSNS